MAALFAALAALSQSGCSDRPADGDGSGEEDEPEVALVMKSLANEFFKTMADGARAYHEEHADEFDLLVNGIKNETDLARQVALVEQMIARGVDALVIAPADSKALVPVLRRAREAGIVVVNIDNRLDRDVLADSGISIPFVGPDNRAGARAVGEALAAHLDEEDEVAILEGVPTAFNARQRRLGFEDAMEATSMEIATVQSAQWEMEKANAVTSAILTAHPELDAVLASNDSMALGAAAAVKSAGRDDAVEIVGFDNISAVREMIREGRILATADQHADRLAVYGIEAALGVLRGESPPEDRNTPVDLITAESLSAEDGEDENEDEG